jgi:hypothetical protein
MLPYARTPIYTAPNGLARYYAYAGADGVAHVAVFGRVPHMQAVYSELCVGVPDPTGQYVKTSVALPIPCGHTQAATPADGPAEPAR